MAPTRWTFYFNLDIAESKLRLILQILLTGRQDDLLKGEYYAR